MQGLCDFETRDCFGPKRKEIMSELKEKHPTKLWIMIAMVGIALVATFVLLQNNKSEEVALEGIRVDSVRVETDPFSNDMLSGSLTVDLYLKLDDFPNGWMTSSKPTSGAWTPLIQKFTDDRRNEFCLRVKNETLGQWYFGYGEGAIILDFVPWETLPLDRWFRLTAIRDFDNAQMSLWIDGRKRVSRAMRMKPAVDR
jgi:hypothetical protein